MEQEIKIELSDSKPPTEAIIAFEEGALTEEQVIELFQHGINHGWVYQLQGFYGRYARQLIALGLCVE